MLSEDRVKQLMWQIVQAVKYLHGFGIVHRDLKLENIMMTDTSDTAKPKIVDFGLAKMIGPNETASEPFGTLGYVGPEILKKMPYSFSCDIWSIGCIMYALLSGSLPFDHQTKAETFRMTIEDMLQFDLPVWKSISLSCKELIARMLIKDPLTRFNLAQVAQHAYFDSVRL